MMKYVKQDAVFMV